MREDSGTNQSTNQSTNRTTDKNGEQRSKPGIGQGLRMGAGQTSAPSRPRPQPAGGPFWVIRGALGSDQTQRARDEAIAASTPQREGRTGVDLRAAGGPGRREPVSGPRTTTRERALPWRHTQRSTPLPASTSPAAQETRETMAGSIATVAETLGARRPKRRRIRINVGLALLALIQIAVLGLIAWGLTSPTWQVRYVQVEGTQDTTLVAAIRKLPLTGCNIFRCDTAQLVRLVEGLPAVASAQVHAAYPDGLIVVVAPRRPALLWQMGGKMNGQAIVVASDGTVLGPQASDPVYAKAALPLVLDDESAAFGGQMPAPGAKMPAIMAEMAGQLRNGMAAALGGSSWSLHYATDNGFVAMGPNGEQVVFGTPVDAASALAPTVAPAAPGSPLDVATVDAGVRAQLDEVRSLEALLANKKQHPALIDVRWGVHPYYRITG